MERQVFVSHAADDPDWTPDAIEAVASAIRDAGIGVRLDLWHERDMKRGLSLSEWRTWMDDAIRKSTHILCLVSPRYLRLWERRPEDAGGFGVAFESIRLIHTLYLLKQRNEGRIFTLRPEAHSFDCIPPDLVLDCTAYRWAADRAKVLSHVGEAALPGHGPTPIPRTPAPAVDNTHLRWARDSGEDQYGLWADLTVNGATQRMRWIPPTGPEGFWMGSTQAERDAIRHKDVRDGANRHEYAPCRETLAQGFWLADTPCTQAFWREVADVDPCHFSAGPEAPERSVENVSWDMVIAQFIARLSSLPVWSSGERPCLPTEVEWEYAARAGTRTAYWWGDAWDDAKGNAGSRDSSTSPMKRYDPNPWGLYDVHGNVWEWCEDAWVERREAREAWPDKECRVVRGGSWWHHPGLARAAYRLRWSRRNAAQYLGFRLALRSPSGPEGQDGSPAPMHRAECTTIPQNP
jgi:formylglycine-generating enzyme required for sulfatase activity